MELNDDALREVSGGLSVNNEAPVAYCPECKKPMKALEDTRIEGGSTGQYICKTPGCKNENKTLNNLQVKFKI